MNGKNAHLFVAATAGVLIVVAVVLWWRVGGTFEQLYADFDAELPLLTRVVLSGPFVAVVVVTSVALTALGLWRRSTLVVLGTYALLGVTMVLFIFGLYLPIFTLAGQVTG